MGRFKLEVDSQAEAKFMRLFEVKLISFSGALTFKDLQDPQTAKNVVKEREGKQDMNAMAFENETEEDDVLGEEQARDIVSLAGICHMLLSLLQR